MKVKLFEKVNPEEIAPHCKSPKNCNDNELIFKNCKDCGAIIEPFDALYRVACQFERVHEQTNAVLEQRKQILNYKPHLVVIKGIEQNYRANNFSMVPVCPNCREPFDLKDLKSWANRRFLKSKKEV